jgi:hypothetical protein
MVAGQKMRALGSGKFLGQIRFLQLSCVSDRTLLLRIYSLVILKEQMV